MLKKKQITSFAAIGAALIAVAIRCYLILNCIDHSTGFYLPSCRWATVFDIFVTSSASLGLAYSFVCPAKPYSHDPQAEQLKSPAKFAVFFASCLLGAFFLHSFLTGSSDNSSILFLPLGIENEPAFFAKLQSLPTIINNLCLLSALVMFGQALLFLCGKHQDFLHSSLLKVVCLFPIAWLITATLKIISAYTSIAFISEHVLEVLALIFMLKTFFSLALLVTSDPKNKTFSKANWVCVYLGAFFGLLSSVPLFVLYISNPSLPCFDPGLYYRNLVQLIVSFSVYNLTLALCLFPRFQNHNGYSACS